MLDYCIKVYIFHTFYCACILVWILATEINYLHDLTFPVLVQRLFSTRLAEQESSYCSESLEPVVGYNLLCLPCHRGARKATFIYFSIFMITRKRPSVVFIHATYQAVLLILSVLWDSFLRPYICATLHWWHGYFFSYCYMYFFCTYMLKSVHSIRVCVAALG